ncbi:hypothetical protein C8T65DRAFT_658354 [Cerioporus squamosus]|nr:hypothetical protein C8T65DRAFT_658354 [Cerioporus squamosus]
MWAMEVQRTLKIPPEVWHVICKNTASLNTLTTLARTSRLVHQYACQQIWHTLPSFVPMFQTMPSDAFRPERNARPHTPSGTLGMAPAVTLKATRPLRLDDLARFAVYAPYIRRIVPRYSSYWGWRNALTGAAYNEYDVSPELWEMLQAIWPSLPLNLEVIQYRQVAYIDCKAYAHPLHLFVGPSLKNLDFTVLYLNEQTGRPDRRTDDMTTQDPILEVFFQRLPELVPRLTSFAFATEVRVFARDALSQALCGLSALTYVKVDRTALRPRAIHQLSTLPALRCLELRVPPRDELLADAWPTGVTVPFAALRMLVLYASQLDECIELLGHVSSSVLQSIAADVREQSSTGTFQAFGSAVSALPSSQTSIRSLVFTLRWIEGLPPEAFEPLLSLSALEELVLSESVCAAVDDATLCAMAQAWPKIRQLTLYHWVDDHTPQRAIHTTVHGLRYFAECCPDLERLDVPLAHITAATFALPDAAYPQLDPLRPHLLERLGVGRPKLHDEAALAGYLSALFPALIYVEHCWEEEFLDRWAALYGVYQAFVRIRAQERSWRAAQTQSPLHEEFRGLGLV